VGKLAVPLLRRRFAVRVFDLRASAPPHAFFVTRANTTVPWTSPWLPPGYEQNFWNAAQSRVVQASPRRRETLVTR
jgi:hypothetical protein